jgi:hypothetical protein
MCILYHCPSCRIDFIFEQPKYEYPRSIQLPIHPHPQIHLSLPNNPPVCLRIHQAAHPPIHPPIRPQIPIHMFANSNSQSSSSQYTFNTVISPHANSDCRGSAAARSLGFRVRVLPRARISVCCECCVLSGRDLCAGSITLPEESYPV